MKFLLTSIEQTSRRLRFQELLAAHAAHPRAGRAGPGAGHGRCCRRSARWRCSGCSSSCKRSRSREWPRRAGRGCRASSPSSALPKRAARAARPLVARRRRPRALGGRGDAVDAVMVFDTSMSMGASDGNKTRLEHARAEAMRVLDQLPPHSTVQIVACAGGTQMLAGPRSPTNLDEAREIIAKLDTTESGHRPVGRRERAASRSSSAGNRPTRSCTSSATCRSKAGRRTLRRSASSSIAPERASVVLVRCGKPAVKNVALVGITPQEGAAARQPCHLRRARAQYGQGPRRESASHADDRWRRQDSCEPQAIEYLARGKRRPCRWRGRSTRPVCTC